MTSRFPLTSLIASAFAVATLCSVEGQGTFQNLDFEQANVPDVPPGQLGGFVAASDGIPGWTAYIGTNQVTLILHNGFSLSGMATIAILGPVWAYGAQSLQGNYTVAFQVSSTETPAIGQVGRVPGTAESLQFYGSTAGDYEVTFGGQPIRLVILGSTASYTIYGADVSSLAGQSGELRFQGRGLLDNILFSDQPIPEPGVLGFFMRIFVARSGPLASGSMTSPLTKELPALVVCCACCLVHGQGTFRNLDFEQATVPPTPVNRYGDRVDPALAFPGWSVGATGNTNADPLHILYNNMTLDAAAVDLIGPEFPSALGLSALQGSYSAMLQYSSYFQIAPYLSQNGLVPADARSISFDATYAPSVALNG
jgi:hypothetical protein